MGKYNQLLETDKILNFSIWMKSLSSQWRSLFPIPGESTGLSTRKKLLMKPCNWGALSNWPNSLTVWKRDRNLESCYSLHLLDIKTLTWMVKPTWYASRPTELLYKFLNLHPGDNEKREESHDESDDESDGPVSESNDEELQTSVSLNNKTMARKAAITKFCNFGRTTFGNKSRTSKFCDTGSFSCSVPYQPSCQNFTLVF
jgi:hypothetical protein